MGSCPSPRCLMAFQHHRGRGCGGDPAVPMPPAPGLNLDPRGKRRGAAGGPLPSPSAGKCWQPPSPGDRGCSRAAGSQHHCSALPSLPAGPGDVCPGAPKRNNAWGTAPAPQSSAPHPRPAPRAGKEVAAGAVQSVPGAAGLTLAPRGTSKVIKLWPAPGAWAGRFGRGKPGGDPALPSQPVGLAAPGARW